MITLAIIPPLLGLFQLDKFSPFIFPPLGDYTTGIKILTIIFIVLLTIAVFYQKERSFVRTKSGIANLAWVFFGIILISSLSFIIAVQLFVEVIPIKGGGTINLSKGYTRHSDIDKSISDRVLIENRGIDDDAIKSIWTLESIIIVRSFLFISYLLIILSIVAFFSCVVMYDLLQHGNSDNNPDKQLTPTNDISDEPLKQIGSKPENLQINDKEATAPEPEKK